jgi:hypothetical protein
MARIRKASSRKPPKVVVTCDVDGLPDDEEERTGHVEVGRPAIDVVSVQSARASVGDMRMLSNAGKSGSQTGNRVSYLTPDHDGA